MDAAEHLYPRRLARTLMERAREYPAVIIQGPRSVGKTTLLNGVAGEADVRMFDLDDPATRAAVALDPALFARAPRPVLIDEYQKVPAVLDAIKAELNRSSKPGQFLLTGSASFESLPRLAQALTGRLHLLDLYPLAQAELEHTDNNLVATLFEAPDSLRGAPSSTTRAEYVRRTVRGGFPLALTMPTPASRARWFDDYLRLTLERDAMEIRQIPRVERLGKLLRRLAGQTAQVLNISKAGAAADLDASTAGEYLKLLEALFLVFRLPAWGTTLTSRTSKSPKIHVLDSGVAARLLLLSEPKLTALQPSAITEFGQLLESFVVSELKRQATWLDNTFTLGHWRTHDGSEVDLVLERGDGQVAAVEVKASGRITDSSFAALRKFRAALRGSFVSGTLLYLGEHAFRTSDGLYAVPVDALWRGPA